MNALLSGLWIATKLVAAFALGMVCPGYTVLAMDLDDDDDLED